MSKNWVLLIKHNEENNIFLCLEDQVLNISKIYRKYHRRKIQNRIDKTDFQGCYVGGFSFTEAIKENE